MFLENYCDKITSQHFEELFNNKCCNLLKQLYEKIDKYELDVKRLENSDYKNALLTDPKWLEIVSLAQSTYDALEHYITEIENAER